MCKSQKKRYSEFSTNQSSNSQVWSVVCVKYPMVFFSVNGVSQTTLHYTFLHGHVNNIWTLTFFSAASPERSKHRRITDMKTDTISSCIWLFCSRGTCRETVERFITFQHLFSLANGHSHGTTHRIYSVNGNWSTSAFFFIQQIGIKQEVFMLILPFSELQWLLALHASEQKKDS